MTVDSAPHDAPHGPNRGRGDRGSGMVAGIAIMFAFTFLGLVWLARDVDRGVSNQSAAQSIAFQAARAGAQSADVDGVRGGSVTQLQVGRARGAATAAASRLFSSYRVSGSVDGIDVDVGAGKVTVFVTITDGSKTVRGVGAARAEQAP